MLEIVKLVLGPVGTNCTILGDTETCQAAVIDPAWDAERILAVAQAKHWNIQQLWVTHAHFDHVGAVMDLLRIVNPPLRAWMHPGEKPLWENQGGASMFGLHLETGPWPGEDLNDGQELRLGKYVFHALHTPGHTPGHCVFYCAEEVLLLSGDLIFKAAVGRTDLPGGDWDSLVESIRNKVFTLPKDTRILPGHGEETSVGWEKRDNPFATDLLDA